MSKMQPSKTKNKPHILVAHKTKKKEPKEMAISDSDFPCRPNSETPKFNYNFKNLKNHKSPMLIINSIILIAFTHHNQPT